MMSLHDVFRVCSMLCDSFKKTIWAQNSILLMVENKSVSYLFIFCGEKKFELTKCEYFLAS